MAEKLPEFALLENTLDRCGNSYYFYGPQAEIIANNGKELSVAFSKMEALQKKALYLVGFVSYEAAYYINPDFYHLRSEQDPRPLLHFVAFAKCTKVMPDFSDTVKGLSQPVTLLSEKMHFDVYQNKYQKIIAALEAGDTYQVNFTKRISLESNASALALYQYIKQQQKVQFSAYLPFFPKQVLSFSPELFFKKEGGTITVKPMKGTAARSEDNTKDKQAYQFLQQDPKNRAENLIIVDLLRNDLASFCKTGSVEVTQAFTIESYQSVYQMTSTIKGKVNSNISFLRILNKLFPCGSITGAPKRRTMEIIHQLEDKRGLYTGAMGYIMPDNDMCFNVAIRTLEIIDNKAQIGVGGGITIQSKLSEEWQEMNGKINFIKRCYRPQFELIESIFYSDGFRSLDLHLQRLKNSAEKFCFTVDLVAIKTELLNYVNKHLLSTNAYKVRLLIEHNGECCIEHQLIDNTSKQVIQFEICPYKIDSSNPLWQHKTTHHLTRGFYNQMHQRFIGKREHRELLFINNNYHITETRFHNIVLVIDNQAYTPKCEDGLLPGIYRQKMLDKKAVIEQSLTLEDLKGAEKIFLVNDVRGKVPAHYTDLID